MEGDPDTTLSQHSGRGISIHSLRMEGDFSLFARENPKKHFNPLPPHGGRPRYPSAKPTSPVFQSTPSAWRETYIHEASTNKQKISIHSLRMEGDRRKKTAGSQQRTFQSTPSAWRETLIPTQAQFLSTISIHSLRMEGDIPECDAAAARKDFNPLPPHGGRLSQIISH